MEFSYMQLCTPDLPGSALSGPSTPPRSGPPGLMLQHYPSWKPAIDMARQCLGSVWVGGTFVGSCLLTQPDTILAPLHLIRSDGEVEACGADLDRLIQSIKIYVSIANRVVQSKSLLEFNQEQDYCVIKLEEWVGESRSPLASYDYPTETLLAKLDDRDQLTVSILGSCDSDFWSSVPTYCSFVRSSPGDSGGIYLTQNGHYVSSHSGGRDGRGAGFLASEMAKSSNHIAIMGSPLCVAEVPPYCISSALLSEHFVRVHGDSLIVPACVRVCVPDFSWR